MKRSKIKKPKNLSSKKDLRTQGLIDLHIHGAFGIDLMSAESTHKRLTELAQKLGEHGISGFCPTTLSSQRDVLLETVTRLGQWIRSTEKSPLTQSRNSALPLGIHLEGPFLSPNACGAHPPKNLRPFDFQELLELWEKSEKTIKILTLAPEHVSPEELFKLTRWAHKNQVILSLGHSRCDYAEAQAAFKKGFTSVTHSWNALSFHHRMPGPLAAAFGNKNVSLELICDQIHVHPKIMEWTQTLHHPHSLCFVSDAAPCAGLPDLTPCSFGDLKVENRDGAARIVQSETLAGGGKLLTEAFLDWMNRPSAPLQTPQTLKSELKYVIDHPLNRLKPSPKTLKRLKKTPKLRWSTSSRGKVSFSLLRS